MYFLTNYQHELMKHDSDVQRLTFLERKSRTRLQFICEQKIFYIRSINDEDQLLRMIIASILLKIFQHYSEKNHSRLNTLKEIIYQSELYNLSKTKGILKEQLHKIIAVQLKQINLNLSSEERIVNIFNSVSFFDETLIQSFKEKFSHSQDVQKDISQFFGLSIVWGEEPVIHAQNSIYLLKKGKHFLKLSQSFENVDLSSEDASSLSDYKNQLNSEKRNLLTISNESKESPFNDHNKENENNSNFNRSSKKITAFNALANSNKSKKTSSIWSILCCGLD